ncbi:flagellar hook-associated protein FlgL [Cohnella sp. REN36]|uniref:flagellar hook-associated protein FlgL n=1 Tax=Cohnella sp. REN36 TaxID=2887347 RepID=UPI001D14A21D|nr:flagellar hook-associated protein FlgL [Cohnella sp. REN36]MCC3374078.1 flagellar hook-associated protein FlgL [Cohnella sp. REN36]
MPIRVTQGMIQSQTINALNKNLNRMGTTQEQLTTGRKINRPSDDPVGITYALRYRGELAMNNQYQRNITQANSALEHVDTVLGQVNDLITRVKELTVKGISDTSTAESRYAISQELDGIYNNLLTLGNDQLNGKFIFNGQKTDESPYDAATAGSFDTDDADILLSLAPGVDIATNISGNKVFGNAADTDNLFKVVRTLRDAFSTNNAPTARDNMAKLDSRLNKFLGIRSEVGARANRIEMLDNRNQDLDVTLNSLSGKTEDADMAKTITSLQTQQNVYQASLSVGAKLIQQSLVDYLR